MMERFVPPEGLPAVDRVAWLVAGGALVHGAHALALAHQQVSAAVIVGARNDHLWQRHREFRQRSLFEDLSQLRRRGGSDEDADRVIAESARASAWVQLSLRQDVEEVCRHFGIPARLCWAAATRWTTTEYQELYRSTHLTREWFEGWGRKLRHEILTGGVAE
jgi:predicted nuclease of predicted toxin-antitoxin system